MKKAVHTSRAGLTRCPACRSHIRLNEKVADTLCPFCNARLLDGAPGLVRRALDVVTSGRGSLIAGALAGALAVGGCGTDMTGSGALDAESEVEHTDDAQATDAASVTDDVQDDVEVSEDVPEPPVGDVYGAPPVDAEVVEDVPQTPVTDVYGAPPVDADQ